MMMNNAFVVVVFSLIFSLVTAQFQPGEGGAGENTGETNEGGGGIGGGGGEGGAGENTGETDEDPCTIPQKPGEVSVFRRFPGLISASWEPNTSPSCFKHFLVVAHITYSDWCGNEVFFKTVEMTTERVDAEIDMAISKRSDQSETTVSVYTIHESDGVEYSSDASRSDPLIVVDNPNNFGSAPSAPPTEVTMDPLVPEGSLSIKWDKPPCGSRHGFIRGYSYRLNSTKGELLESGNTDVPLVHFQNVEAGDYLFEVAAKNDEGVGPYSDLLEATVDQSAEWNPRIVRKIEMQIERSTQKQQLLMNTVDQMFRMPCGDK